MLRVQVADKDEAAALALVADALGFQNAAHFEI